MSTNTALILNAGSSSLKAVLLAGDGALLWKGQTTLSSQDNLTLLLEDWLSTAITPWRESLGFIAHRVVHGGDHFTAPTRLTPEVIEALEALIPLAPLHNGPALRLISAMARWGEDLDQWACFDTAFHSTMPPEASTYAVPLAWREQGLRRYGFHGLNHQHVSEVVLERFKPAESVAPLRLISCHLGAGCSLCAIRDGRSIATTMGFTPMEGLVMATRSGSIDPGLMLQRLRQGQSVDDLDRELNGNSGLLGLSGWSGSMKDLREAIGKNSTIDPSQRSDAALAIAVFRHALLQGIGAMAASLGGVDVIAFTGGIGEHDAQLRDEVISALDWLQPFEVEVIPAEEERLIARLCRNRSDSADPMG